MFVHVHCFVKYISYFERLESTCYKYGDHTQWWLDVHQSEIVGSQCTVTDQLNL